MWVRGGLAIDGFFALPRAQCGAPTLAARRTVVISALPKVLDLLWLYLLWLCLLYMALLTMAVLTMDVVCPS